MNVYYTYISSLKDNEIRKKKIFYKAYNIGLGNDQKLSINMVFNVFLWSNETIRVTLALTDLQEKDKQEPVNCAINFSKQSFLNGSKIDCEMIEYKNFYFIIQISFATLDNFESWGFIVDLSCTTNEDNLNTILTSIPAATKLCWIYLINVSYC
jgi:hypothetical protein